MMTLLLFLLLFLLWLWLLVMLLLACLLLSRGGDDGAGILVAFPLMNDLLTVIAVLLNQTRKTIAYP